MAVTQHAQSASSSPPDRERLTLAEYLAREDGARLVEWMDGEAVFHMPPSSRHQEVQAFLFILLRHFADFLGLGRVVPAPYLMLLGPEGPGREPDILFVAHDHMDRILPDRLNGPADLAVELVSNDSVARDRAEKFYEYQEAGVREYWVIDPRPRRQRADFWVLDAEGLYQPAPIVDGVYRSRMLEGFWLRMAWLQADAPPDPLLCFAEVAGLPPDVTQALRDFKGRGRGSQTP